MNINDIRRRIMEDQANVEFTKQAIEPLFSAPEEARIIIIGQAPGRLAQESKLYWNDPSGDRLRDWMGISREEFYDSDYIAQLPMDFYFPGKAKSGDNPPRKDFAAKWHPLILEQLGQVDLTLLIGAYSQKHYLGKSRQRNLTETVRHYNDYLPDYFPLVHPSPLNYGWMKKNPWFEKEVIPDFQLRIREIFDR